MKKNGFTLIEAFVVLGIVSVLSLLAAPSFVDQIKSARLTSATNVFVGTINLARSEAIKRGTNVYAVFNDNKVADLILPIILYPIGCDNRSCAIRVTDTLPSGFNVVYYDISYNGNTMISTRVDSVAFKSDGSVNPPGYLKICTPDNMKVIRVNFNGHAKIAKDTNDNGIPELFNEQTRQHEDSAACT